MMLPLSRGDLPILIIWAIPILAALGCITSHLLSDEGSTHKAHNLRNVNPRNLSSLISFLDPKTVEHREENHANNIEHILPPAEHEMDVVIVAGAINCATQTTVHSLRQYLHPSPRNIHLILPGHVVPVCDNIWSHDPSIACHSEHDVVPLTNAELQVLFDEKGPPWTALGDRTGWYLQQFVKLFAYRELGPHNISRRFALWDSDLEGSPESALHT